MYATVAHMRDRPVADLSTLDAFLDEEGVREAFQAVAIKEVLAWRMGEAMKAQKLSRKRMAERMGTSRSQVNRLLNPEDGNVTLVTLQRAAEILGLKLTLDLALKGHMERDRKASTETIDLLMTDDERAALESAAFLQQKSVNAFVVETALSAARALLGEGQSRARG